MNDPSLEKDDDDDNAESGKDIHPLAKLSVVAVGTKIGATVILKMAKYPILLFGMGIVSGYYINKNRKEIIAAAEDVKQYAVSMGKKKDDN
jgi:hypothetical protein